MVESLLMSFKIDLIIGGIDSLSFAAYFGELEEEIDGYGESF